MWPHVVSHASNASYMSAVCRVSIALNSSYPVNSTADDDKLSTNHLSKMLVRQGCPPFCS